MIKLVIGFFEFIRLVLWSSLNLTARLPPVQKSHARPLKLCHLYIFALLAHPLKKEKKKKGTDPPTRVMGSFSTHYLGWAGSLLLSANLQVDSSIWLCRTNNIHLLAYPLYVYTDTKTVLFWQGKGFF